MSKITSAHSSQYFDSISFTEFAIPKPAAPLNKRFAMLRLPCSALRILKRLQHIKKFQIEIKLKTNFIRRMR
ncbi:MAG: hypothetical protein LBH59_09610 [Planctomycetaceae bacterium]|nr:hypothetical protein [Planctomycetaceae bacterium]